MPIPLFVVDAFTDTAFAGNPAAVCLLDRPADAGWMLCVATEMNLPMTAFVVGGSEGWDLRWFRAAGEEQLCGHATVAAAHVLWEKGLLDPGQVARFDTRAGTVTATRHDDWVEIDFPAEPAGPADPETDLAGLGAPALFVGRNARDVIVEVASESVLGGLRPDPAWLAGVDARCVVVTSGASTAGVDYTLRVFGAGPSAGGEDPVTGSAQCSLGPFWAERLGFDQLVARQLSDRGGRLRVHVRGDRVGIAGRAVTVLEGSLRVR